MLFVLKAETFYVNLRYMAIRLVTYEHSEALPNLPGKNVFHSVSLFRILERTSGFSPFMLVAFNGDRPIGKLLCVVRKSWFISKCIVYDTGEYFDADLRHDLIFDELLSYFTNRNKDNFSIIEFRNLSESLFGYRYFRQNGYFPIRRLRVINSIHHSTIDKWMGASRKRQIQCGLRNGAVMGVADTEEQVRNLFRMLKKYYSSKVFKYFPAIDFFTTLLEQRDGSDEIGKIFTVSYNGRIIGGSCCSASQLKARNKRYSSLPFDWLAHVKLNLALDFLLNNFEGFLIRNQLAFVKREKHEAHFKMPNGIVFKHDFKSDNLEDFPKVEKKYQRRIKRLYQKINHARSLLFVHFDYDKPQKEILVEACKRLRSYYPDKKIKLLYVVMCGVKSGYQIVEDNPDYELALLEHDDNASWVGRMDLIKEIFAPYTLSLKSKLINFLFTYLYRRKKDK